MDFSKESTLTFTNLSHHRLIRFQSRKKGYVPLAANLANAVITHIGTGMNHSGPPVNEGVSFARKTGVSWIQFEGFLVLVLLN
jgi:hypothetical protein